MQEEREGAAERLAPLLQAHLFSECDQAWQVGDDALGKEPLPARADARLKQPLSRDQRIAECAAAPVCPIGVLLQPEE